MDILVSTLCDFAADYQGKLCIQGGFDSLVARQFPVVHPVCAVALRICLTPEDEGTHELGLSIVDADGTPLDKERMLIKIIYFLNPPPVHPAGGFLLGCMEPPSVRRRGDENHRFHVPMKAGSLTKPSPRERRWLSGLRTEKLFKAEPRLIFLFY